MMPPVERRILRVAAIAVIGVFAALPVLVRIHDRLSQSDAPTAFRISKNLERPHEKHVVQPAIRPAASTALHNAPSCSDVIQSDATDLTAPVWTPSPVRAPPPTAAL